MGPSKRSAGERFFLRARGEAVIPGRYRFHLRVGQPLASDCRSVADWDPFLGLMRFGRVLAAVLGHRRRHAALARTPARTPLLSPMPATCATSPVVPSAERPRNTEGGARGLRVTDKASSTAELQALDPARRARSSSSARRCVSSCRT